MDIENVGRV